MPVIQGYAQLTSKVNYTIDDGLPSNMVYCVQQDSTGFMWFGTDAGLSRFDGYEFINFSLADGLPDTEILNFFKDSKSRIWFYTLNGKIGFLHKNKIFSSTNTEWLKDLDFNGRITSIVEFNDKIYFAAHDSKIKILEGGDVQTVDLIKSFPYSICACNDQILLFGQSSIKSLVTSKVFDFRKKGLRINYFTYPTCFENIVYSIDRGHLNNAILTFDTKKWELRRNPLPIRNRILSIGSYKKSPVVFSRNGSFGAHLQSDSLHFREHTNFKSPASMYFDNQNNTWITSLEKGVYFAPENNIKEISDYTFVTALNRINNHLYVAHEKNRITQINKEGQESTIQQFAKKNWLFFISKDSINRLWVGRDDGIYVDGENISYNAISIYHTDARSILGSRNSYLEFSDDLKNTVKKEIFSYILDIDKYRDTLLLATHNGLLYFENDSIIPFLKSDLSFVRVNQMEVDKKNRLWLATGGKGLIRIGGESPLSLSTDHGLISNSINKILIVDSTLWLVSPKGIMKVNFQESNPEILILDKLNGLTHEKINAIEWFNGQIYIGTNAGLLAFPDSINLKERNDFHFFISGIYDDERSLTNKFDYGSGSLQVEFKALNYKNQSSLSYQYQLLTNKDSISNNHWINSDINKVNFSTLRPNEYTFYVRAKTKNSRWSPPIKYEFEVIPLFWQKLSFQTALLLTLLTIIFLAIRRYYKSKTSRKDLEKAKISAEIKALKAQINPHFVFNALNSIQSFVLEGDFENTDDYLIKYGKLMRKVLDHSESLTVPLSDELEMLQLYIDLEKLRFEVGFDFEINVSDELDQKSMKIPSMIIQPFIENAIWHGLSPKEGQGKIHLMITVIDEIININISDNGIGFENNGVSATNHDSKGSNLVSERLQLVGKINGFTPRIRISSKLNVGTTVEIAFPKHLN
ncbi:sensor histidine kinase [Ekhidna lutea]|uniref:sensor histidine kinase n=1 Tax=Ekhidna lutea TaxID=447679 RepID=UPI0015C5F195|nr:sensor histidine kinase [Ekhidna lutea]